MEEAFSRVCSVLESMELVVKMLAKVSLEMKE